MISALPEILPDGQHPAMAVSFFNLSLVKHQTMTKSLPRQVLLTNNLSHQVHLTNNMSRQVHLNTMLDEVRPHTASIVDCLSNLTLSREASKQVGINFQNNEIGRPHQLPPHPNYDPGSRGSA